MRAAFLTIVCACLFITLSAQHIQPKLFCATDAAKLPWLDAYQREGGSSHLRSNEILYIPVVVHLVSTTEGKKSIQEGQILDAFCTLNNHFRQANIQFLLQQPFRYIQNTGYYDHTSAQVAGEMMLSTRVVGAVNTYFVFNAADACGYTLRDQTGIAVGIALSAECTGLNTSSWAHEMGHVFSLPHTFNGWENYTHNYNLPAPLLIQSTPVEKLDRSNCRTAGDGFCDTPPDYLNGRWLCTENAVSQITQRDPNGVQFQSDGSLLMGYAADPCANRFSIEQRAAMRMFILQKMPGFVVRGLSIPTTSREEINLLQPNTGSLLPGQDLPTLLWASVSDAEAYLLEIAPIPSFSVTSLTIVTQDTFFKPSLPTGRAYFWRIRPFNKFNTCAYYSKTSSFTTTSVTSTPELELVKDLKVFPNPAIGQVALNLELEGMDQAILLLTLTDALGRKMTAQQWQIYPGRNSTQLGIQHLPSGTYFLHIMAGHENSVRKIIISPSP